MNATLTAPTVEHTFPQHDVVFERHYLVGDEKRREEFTGTLLGENRTHFLVRELGGAPYWLVKEQRPYDRGWTRV